MIDTILFDLDGTLLNTNDLIIATFLHTLDHYYPNRYTEKDIIEFIGEPLEISFAKVDPERVEEMVKHYRKYNVEKHDEMVREFPHVNETLAILKEKGYKLAIVTSKRWKTVELGLKLANLEPFFDTIVTIDDIEKPKPDPEPLILACEKIGSTPDRAMMVGDSPSDIEAGHRAGAKTVAVSWTLKGTHVFSDVKPDFIIDDMQDMLSVVESLQP